MKLKNAILSAACLIGIASAWAQNNIAEEVAWMIGDEPIYKSEIEQAYKEYLEERIPIKGDPYCVIPEQLAVQRLYLHQADLDTVEVQQAFVQSNVDATINNYIASLGSREKVEQYFRKSIPDLREQLTTLYSNQQRVRQVQENLTKNFKTTPSDVRKYFNTLVADSIPYVPLQVEAQIITLNPTIPREEIEDTKARLREFTERINNGSADFSTLAILYSQDPGSSSRGGELGFMGRSELVPEYAAVAFNLNDPKKVSKIVETEFGFHIIQLIEKRGDRINTRHILLTPKVAEKDLVEALGRLDTLRTNIVDEKKISFEDAARYYSQDKDTRYSNGVMMNQYSNSTLFEMQQLPQEVAKVVATLEPGQVSAPFIMKDPKSSRDQVAIVKLTNRVEPHRANLSDDYQLILEMYEQSAKQKILNEWLEKKIKDTYVKIEDGWRGCTFQHEGWIK